LKDWGTLQIKWSIKGLSVVSPKKKNELDLTKRLGIDHFQTRLSKGNICPRPAFQSWSIGHFFFLFGRVGWDIRNNNKSNIKEINFSKI
jgi:hypothetical protein